jgi:hypothetical protein
MKDPNEKSSQVDKNEVSSSFSANNIIVPVSTLKEPNAYKGEDKSLL